ncbi:MAG: T9SS type A sorting domain-containing protein [Bacteroidetes bacterium]|nr:T9SS type A sorting domain-containing protein [Bacteroidota bacterium]
MKNRFLPFGLLTLSVGFAFLFSSWSALAGNSGVLNNPANPSDDQLYRMKCNQLSGKLDPRDILKAKEQIQHLNSTKSTSGLNLNWIEIGPNNAAGRTRAILYDNKNASGAIYAGAVTGGIWKSTNNGLTWHQQNTQSNEVLRVTSLVQTANGTIYAGTGETYCGNNQNIGTGLYRSTDGENFQSITSTQPVFNDVTSDWAYITKLAINKLNSRIFAATNTGLKYSDNGDDWTTILTGNATEVEIGPEGSILAVVDNTAYLAVAGDLNNLVNISTGTDTTLPAPALVGGIEFAIAPSDANVMYATVLNGDKKLLNVYKSGDKGLTWTIIFPANSTFEPFFSNGCYTNTLVVFPNNPDELLVGGENMWHGKKYAESGNYSWEQVSFGFFSPLFPMYVPYNHHNYLFNPNDPTEFAIASDGGITIGHVLPDVIYFQTVIKNYNTSQFNSIAIGRLKNYVMGGGMSIGTQIIGPYQVNEPMNGTQVYNGTGGNCAWSMIDPAIIIFSKTPENPPFYRSENLGVTVSPTFLGSGADSIATMKVPYIPIYLYENFNFETSRDSVKFYARDHAVSANSTIIIESKNSKFPFTYITPDSIPLGDSIMVKDIVQSRFYIFGGFGGSDSKEGIFMTKDALRFSVDPKWFKVASTTHGGNDAITCIDVSKDGNYMWVGAGNGNLYRVSNLALAHDSATADVNNPTCIVATEAFDGTVFPFLLNRYITSVKISPDNDNLMLVTLGNYGNDNYVYITENALDSLPTFRPVQGNLPFMPVYSGLIEVNNHNRVLLGTDFGVYSTDDISATDPVWTATNTGIGNVPVTQIKQQTINYYPIENYGVIYLSTYGRGFFMDTTYYSPLGIDPGPVVNATSGEIQIQPNPARNMITVSYTVEKPANVTANVFDLTGNLLQTISFGNQQAGDHSLKLNLGTLPDGTYIIRINNSLGKVVKIK